MKSILRIAGSIFVFFVAVLIDIQTVEARPQPLHIQKIIGTNDLVAVAADASNIPVQFRSLVDAFGVIGVGCTATHIGHGYVLTAGHCFAGAATPVTDQDCSAPTNDIKWGYRDGVQPYLTSKCVKVVIAQTTAQMDYALLKVDPAPTAFVKPNLLTKGYIGESVTIFSHPDDLTLRWSQDCTIQQTPDANFDPAMIDHQCDTDPGSSGAVLIDVNTLEIVGIHDGGYVDAAGAGWNYATYLFGIPLVQTLQQLGF